MRKFTLKMLIFVLLIGGLMQIINRAVVRVAGVYKDGAAIICEEKRAAVRQGVIKYVPGKINVLFFGHSKMLAGITPAYFDELNDGRTHSWNLALPGLPIGASYYTLHDYLKRNPAPEYVIINPVGYVKTDSGVFEHYACQGASPVEAASYLCQLRTGKMALNYFHPIRMYATDIKRYTTDRLRNPAKLAKRERQNSEMVNEMLSDRGYYFIREQAAAGNALPHDFRLATDGTNNLQQIDSAYQSDPFMWKFFDLTEAHHINVLVIQTPTRPGEMVQESSMPEYLTQILTRYQNVKIAQDGWKCKVYPTRLFSDPVHVNPAGAKRFTRQVCEEFQRVQPISSAAVQSSK